MTSHTIFTNKFSSLLQAQDVLDKTLGEGHPKCNTLDIKLHGGEGYSESLSIQLIQKYGIMEDVAEVNILHGSYLCPMTNMFVSSTDN